MRPVFLVLLDISGYTRFTKAHRLTMLHAELIIGDLLESILSRSKYPLVIHEMLGDAVSFYVEAAGTTEVAHEGRRQVGEIFEAFRRREAELISECGLCACEACKTVGKLRLKAILHHGQAAFTRVRDFQKISGEDVILAHRLLKNSIPSGEYVLETQAFFRIGGEIPGQAAAERTESVEGLGAFAVKVFYPFGAESEVLPVQKSLPAKVWMEARAQLYVLRRLFGKRGKTYRNLGAGPPSTRAGRTRSKPEAHPHDVV